VFPHGTDGEIKRGRESKFVGGGGGSGGWEDICMQIEEPCILSLLSRSRECWWDAGKGIGDEV
jgi:hypothetical protein